MKINLTFKTPGVLDYLPENLSDEEREDIMSKLEKWLKYSEYLYVEYDTESDEMKVLRQKK